VVVPIYGCDESLYELHQRLTYVLTELVSSHEIIFVDDCGPGNPWSAIEDLSRKDESVVGIRFSRNFGQHVAITAGLEQSRGEWIVVMDCDDIPMRNGFGLGLLW